MKLGIVIPLKSRQVAKDWSLTCENLRATLKSALTQTESAHYIIIVGHEKPEFLSDPAYSQHPITFAFLDELSPPQKTDDRSKNQLLYEKDRCTKILKGIVVLRKIRQNIKYWFPLDADDLLREDFVYHVMRHFYDQHSDAIILNKGFVFFKSSNSIIKENQFSLYCGSSAILHDDLIPSFDEISDRSYQKFLFGEVTHAQMLHQIQKRAWRVHVPNERLIMYCKDNGENISDDANAFNFFYYIKRTLKIYLKKIYLRKTTDTIRLKFQLNK